MCNWIVTLILTNSIITVYAHGPHDPVAWRNFEVNTKELAKQILVETNLDEALPVVLFLMDEGTPREKLEHPEGIVQAIVKDCKIVSGTKFYVTGSGKQIFFCTKQNSEGRKCLAPQNFENFEQLRCEEQPIPYVRQRNIPYQCGIFKSGIPLLVYYDICSAVGPHQYKTQDIQIYNICYNEVTGRTLFTTHSIFSQKLLKSNLLYRDRKLSYSELNPSTTSMYRTQHLVPPGDMLFGVYIKALREHYNFEFQHNSIFKFWNEINKRVRKEEIQLPAHHFLIRTGVFPCEVILDESFRNNEQRYNRWVKVIIARKKNEEELSGIAFIMSNFLISGIPKISRRLFKNEMKNMRRHHCADDFCDPDFKERVEKAGSSVNCCKVIPAIKHWFGLEGGEPLRLLQINGLTRGDDD